MSVSVRMSLQVTAAYDLSMVKHLKTNLQN